MSYSFWGGCPSPRLVGLENPTARAEFVGIRWNDSQVTPLKRGFPLIGGVAVMGLQFGNPSPPLLGGEPNRLLPVGLVDYRQDGFSVLVFRRRFHERTPFGGVHTLL